MSGVPVIIRMAGDRREAKRSLLTFWKGLIIASVLLLTGCQTAAEPLRVGSPEPAGFLPPEEVVRSFYDHYLLYPGNPLSDGAYADNPTLRAHLDDSLVDVVDAELVGMDRGGYDPFLCAQAVPDAVDVRLLQVDEGRAEVLVFRTYGAGTDDMPLSVRLEQTSTEGWLMVGIDCAQLEEPEVMPPAAPAEVPLPSVDSLFLDSQWLTYPAFGFGMAFPGGWELQLLDVDARPGDPVEGYAHFFSEHGTIPLALVFLRSDEDTFRTYFPEPEGGGEVVDVAGVVVRVEEVVPGERYYFVASPFDPQLRVALRLIDRTGDLDEVWEDVVMTMLGSLRWEEEE